MAGQGVPAKPVLNSQTQIWVSDGGATAVWYPLYFQQSEFKEMPVVKPTVTSANTDTDGVLQLSDQVVANGEQISLRTYEQEDGATTPAMLNGVLRLLTTYGQVGSGKERDFLIAKSMQDPYTRTYRVQIDSEGGDIQDLANLGVTLVSQGASVAYEEELPSY